MVQVPCLILLLALFSGAELLRLKNNEKGDKAISNKFDLVRPRRTVYAIGAGDNYMMTKLTETNSRLTNIEATLFRIENVLNFLQGGGSIPLPHAANIIKKPSQAGQVSAQKGDAPALPASRSAQSGSPNPPGMHHGQQPPQFQHHFLSQQQSLPHLQAQPPSPRNGAVNLKNIQVGNPVRIVHWMDSKCSEPCGKANVPNGNATAPAAAQKRSAPPNANPDAIEVKNMRVVGGEESMKHKYPWQVYIQMYLSVGGVARCGGSIINDRYVITAGHCTYTGNKACAVKLEPGAMSVTVAEHNINSMNDDIRGVTDRIDVKEIIRHPKYCASTVEMDNDVALLHLAEVLYLPDIHEIGHICLPVGPSDNFSGMTATVAGWGYKEEDFDERSHTDLAGKLQEVDFKIHPDCSSYPNPEDITDNMICAGDEKNIKDACGGDSGGPLMIQKNGQYTLAGLVSFGPDGGDCTGEGVYVKLANYIQWIRENTMDAGC